MEKEYELVWKYWYGERFKDLAVKKKIYMAKVESVEIEEQWTEKEYDETEEEKDEFSVKIILKLL